MKRNVVRWKFAMIFPSLFALGSCGDDPVAPFAFTSPPEINAVAHGRGLTVAVGVAGISGDIRETAIIVSRDGEHWERPRSAPTGGFYDIIFVNDRFVAVGNRVLAVSPDGQQWFTNSVAEDYWFSNVVYGNGRLIATGTVYDEPTPVVAVSVDGINWEIHTSHNYLGGRITFGGGKFLAWGHSGLVQISVDGVTWESKLVTNLGSIAALVYEGGAFRGMGYVNSGNGLSELPLPVHAVQSVDGESWTINTLEQAISIESIIFHRGRWFGISDNSIWSSEDRISWELEITQVRPLVRMVSHGNRLIAVGWGVILTRRSASSWLVQSFGLSD